MDAPNLLALDLGFSIITHVKVFAKCLNSKLEKLTINGDYFNDISPLFRAKINSKNIK
jgi:hypothetical protein